MNVGRSFVAVLAGLCCLAGGCSYIGLGSTPEMDAAIAKIPLYPGFSEFRLDGRDYQTDFYITATYDDMEMGAIDTFYRDYFRENAWTNNFADEEESNGMLDFAKDKVEMHVTLMDLGGKTQVMVIYKEREHTRAEFDALVREKSSPEALAAIERMKEVYAAVETYADTGTHESINDGEVLSQGTFRTRYRAPGDLLFEYSDTMGDFHTAHTLSKLGDAIQYMSSYDTEPTVETEIYMAIAALYGVTSTTSGNVPELLLGLNHESALFRLTNLKVLEDANAPDGATCVRIHGKDFNGAENTIWIGKDDMLIRKIESVQDDKNRDTITYSPKLNAEIAPEDLAFKKPVADSAR